MSPSSRFAGARYDGCARPTVGRVWHGRVCVPRKIDHVFGKEGEHFSRRYHTGNMLFDRFEDSRTVESH